MALIIKDRVKETTTTTGTGTITLAGASTGFRSFADIGNANTTYYTIAGGNDWEVGLGTYTASGTTLSRDTVLSNSLGTTAKINFSAGTKDVFCTYPSGKAILGDTSSVSSTGTGSVVLSASPTLTGTVQLPNSSFSSVTSTIGYAANVSVGQTNYLTNNTIQIGGNEPDPIGGAASTINIGANYTEVGESSANPTTTNINGNVVFPAATASESVIFNKQVSITSGTSFSVAGNLSLTGSATVAQNIATAQTTGSLTIGGTGASATGAINIGSGTGGQSIAIANATSGAKTVNIASGANSSSKSISIGTGGTGSVNITIGSTGSASGSNTINGSTNLIGATKSMGINPTQTTGVIDIGGTSGTAAITLGKSTLDQTINIGTGSVASTKTKTIKIGTGDGGGSAVIQLGNDSPNYCAIEAHGSILQTVTSTMTNVVLGPGARSFTDSHYSSSVYPPFGEIYSDSGVFGPFTVPLYHDGSDWRVG